ncbi:hypothetical protein FACS1894142_5870 [Spirochaetia bacterium]|nr:hypothetical protein FACS1894142_5870 [Spirochaetia bacterium]GHU58407.1 hypothetical protein FACS189444_2020 [Spirochaetia bacterium]
MKFPIDILLYLCYTINMKTAISLSNVLYEKAEETASYMGIPRSKLFAIALEEFIIRHNGNMIIEKINEVYEKIDQTEFEPNLNVILDSQRDVTKNDTW